MTRLKTMQKDRYDWDDDGAVTLDPVEIEGEAPEASPSVLDRLERAILRIPTDDGTFSPVDVADHVAGPAAAVPFVASEAAFGRRNLHPGALAVGAGDAVTFGHTDELGAVVRSLMNEDESYREAREHTRARRDQAIEESPHSYAAGVGTIGLATGAVQPLAASLPGRIAQAAAEAGVSGAGFSEADAASEPMRLLQDAGKAAATGGVVTGALSLAGRAIGGVRNLARGAEDDIAGVMDDVTELQQLSERFGQTTRNRDKMDAVRAAMEIVPADVSMAQRRAGEALDVLDELQSELTFGQRAGGSMASRSREMQRLLDGTRNTPGMRASLQAAMDSGDPVAIFHELDLLKARLDNLQARERGMRPLIGEQVDAIRAALEDAEAFGGAATFVQRPRNAAYSETIPLQGFEDMALESRRRAMGRSELDPFEVTRRANRGALGGVLRSADKPEQVHNIEDLVRWSRGRARMARAHDATGRAVVEEADRLREARQAASEAGRGGLGRAPVEASPPPADLARMDDIAARIEERARRLQQNPMSRRIAGAALGPENSARDLGARAVAGGLDAAEPASARAGLATGAAVPPSLPAPMSQPGEKYEAEPGVQLEGESLANAEPPPVAGARTIEEIVDMIFEEDPEISEEEALELAVEIYQSQGADQ